MPAILLEDSRSRCLVIWFCELVYLKFDQPNDAVRDVNLRLNV